MLVLLDRDGGRVEADPPDKNFQSPVWGSSSTIFNQLWGATPPTNGTLVMDHPRPVASSKSAGVAPGFRWRGHEDQSVEGVRIEGQGVGLRAGADPGVEIGGPYRPIWRVQSTSLYNGGLRAVFPARFRGRAPGQGIGAKPPEAEHFCVVICLKWCKAAMFMSKVVNLTGLLGDIKEDWRSGGWKSSSGVQTLSLLLCPPKK